MSRILVTGGAGFIGCHVVQSLLKAGYDVRVLDSLIDQVHDRHGPRNPILAHTDFVEGDVRDASAVATALRGVDRVIHLAAEVGVGQSMYAIERYVSVNDQGTAVLCEALVARPVERLVVASSMSIYGEGLYRTQGGEVLPNVIRPAQRGGGWDPTGPDGAPLTPLPTPEWKQPNLASVYALTKYVQERLALTVAPAYGMESVALRLFNVYGPGQALSNPYTGVLAIFASRLLHRERPMAAARFCARPGCRGRVHAGAGAPGRRGAGVQHRQRPRRIDPGGSRRFGPGNGGAASHARGDGQGPHRGHPPLFRRYRIGRERARLPTEAVVRCQPWRRQLGRAG